MKFKKNKSGANHRNHNMSHDDEHRVMARRQFLNTVGKGSALSIFMGGFSLQAFSSPELNQALNFSSGERILVLIQMAGGNDGLNTLIPLYDYDYYRNIRPAIGYTTNQIIKLNDDIAIPANCTAWEGMWKDGMMKAIQGVGYPEQNLSHFRSSDIWSTASDANEVWSSGWLGRYLDDLHPDFENQPPAIPPAVQIGGFGSLMFNNGMFNMAVNVTNPEELSDIAKNGELFNTKNVPNSCYGEELRFLRTVTNSTFVYSEAIQKAYLSSENKAEYNPIASDLANQLAIVARLIKGGLGTRLYMVTINGFDTHANQNNIHPYLLQDIADGVQSFYDDLSADSIENDVLAVTFSEFGRRIEENASSGTDHGSAAPVMLFGPGVEDQGILGDNISLREGDVNGNLKFEIDFRSIYATLLEHWMCLDGPLVDQLLGRHFSRLDNLVATCGAITSANPNIKILPKIAHKVLYSPDGAVRIKYVIPNRAEIHLKIYNMQGQIMADIHEGIRHKGEHLLFLQSIQFRLSPGTYVYHLHVDQRQFSNKFIISG